MSERKRESNRNHCLRRGTERGNGKRRKKSPEGASGGGRGWVERGGKGREFFLSFLRRKREK